MSCIFKSDNVCVRVRTFVRKGMGDGAGKTVGASTTQKQSDEGPKKRRAMHA